MANPEIREGLKCPMCGAQLEHREKGESHIYTCEDCPFVGFEFFGMANARDLLDYLK